MSRIILYNGIKTALTTLPYTKSDGSTDTIRHIALWNNQLAHENEENAFLYPAVFIEFLPSNYKELTNGVQQYDMIVRLHICFETYKDVDLDILNLTEAVFSKMHKKQYEYFGQLLRVEETQNFDHPNVQDYMQDYKTMGKDYNADTRPRTPVIAAPIINTTIVQTIP